MFKFNIGGAILAAIGIALFFITDIAEFLLLMLIGILLLASLPQKNIFVDYIMENEQEALCRIRHYLAPLPLTLISSFLTLGKGKLLIPIKQEYIKSYRENPQQTPTLTRVSRKEYLALRNAQRKLYSTKVMDKDFIARNYSPAGIGLKQKKTRLILASVFAAAFMALLTIPDALPVVVIYEAVFLPMVFLWIPPYKDAKILQTAYDRAMKA